MNYTFSTLNDKEFEHLVRDLLNAKYNLRLQSFKEGKDKGRDLRSSTEKNPDDVVVQIKHYLKSGYSHLKKAFEEVELDKVKLLKPNRYIIATSLPLSAYQKDQLTEIMKPFIISPSDILGQDDLNQLILEFGDIEKKYFKLWFSSTNILNAILNNAIESRTKNFLENIKRKIPFYVVTDNLNKALTILQKEKILLISGQPGIGKTTLSEIIILDKARIGYKVYKIENISEAEDVFSPDSEEKQIFYFDDFLGANYLEIVSQNKTESQITSFVDRIRSSPNKFLILTTRTVIMNYAVDKFEKIARSRLSEEKYELRLEDYSLYDKALILYNHFFFFNISSKYFEVIQKHKFYRHIIEHANYTPRIIEFVTQKNRIEKIPEADYKQFIINNLNNPKEIWRYSFENQINYLDKCLLLTLFTFEKPVPENILLDSFNKRLLYERQEHNQIIRSSQFNDSISILLDSFISSTIFNNISNRTYSFINPSIIDFLINYVNNSYSEKKAIIESICYAEQLNRFRDTFLRSLIEPDLQSKLSTRIANDEIKYLRPHSENNKILNHIITLINFCEKANIDDIVLGLLSRVDFVGIKYDSYGIICEIIMYLPDLKKTNKFIADNFDVIISTFIKAITTKDEAEELPYIFYRFEKDYKSYAQSHEGRLKIKSVIERLGEKNYKELMYGLEDTATEISDVENAYYEAIEFIESLANQLLEEDIEIDGLNHDDFYWEGVVKSNLERNSYEGDSSDDVDEVYINNEESEIDVLFSEVISN